MLHTSEVLNQNVKQKQVEKTGKKVVDQKRKLCKKCHEEKKIDCFRKYKSGKNKGYYHSYCKKCSQLEKNKYMSTYRKVYRERKPWMIVWNRIKTRCEYDKNNRYYIRGIRVNMTVEELKYLWVRDSAYLLKKPSLDRIDGNKNYIKDNCRFIELSDNLKRNKLTLE